jgi:hypothetical protein
MRAQKLLSLFILSLGVVLLTMLSFASADVPTQAIRSVALSPSKDNTLYEDDAGSLSNGAGDYFFVGRTGGGAIRRGVIAFDIAGHIPAASIIVSVTLKLDLSRTSSGAQSIALHRLLTDWGEGTSNAVGEEGSGAASASGDATWLHTFYDADFWAKPGGDFSPTASATATVDGIGSYTWATTEAMVADVQLWRNTPEANFGWLLLGNESKPRTSKRFNARENSDPETRPELIVEYLPPKVVYLPIILKN